MIKQRKEVIQMVIDDKELKIQKRAKVNGITCTWFRYPRLDVSFVLKNDDIVWAGAPILAKHEYDQLVSSCLEQIYQENIVEGSLAEI